MTRSDRGRHEPFEELISASLTGDLSEAERAQLESHLRECADCRATLDAFVTGRRLVAGLHHIPPPRDLHARVRAGIEPGAWEPVPWWRRPAAVFAGLAGGSALVAAALLVLVLNQTDRDQVAQTQTPAPTFSAPPATTPQPEATAQASLAPSQPVVPSGTPIPATPAPEPQTILALTPPSPDPSVQASAPAVGILTLNTPPPAEAPSQSIEPIATLPPVMGPPIAAAISPNNGEWLAYLTDVTDEGTVEIWLARDDGEALGPLAEGRQGSPFTEVMSWSPDGRFLAFTLIAESAANRMGTEGTQEQISDVWLVDVESDSQEPLPLTGIGRAIAGTFDPDGNLWLSVVAETSTSYLLPADALSAVVDAGEPLTNETLVAEASLTAPDLFQPLVAPDGSALIAWQGRFDDEEGRLVQPFYSFTQGGAPQIVELVKPRLRQDGGAQVAIGEAKPLFGDLPVDRDGFRYAAIAWGADGRAIAVWDAAWTGEQQEDAYPDPLRVYFGKSNYSEPINRSRVLDADDLPAGIAEVIDVAVAPDGKHLAITASYARGGLGEPPRADLILVRRNTGNQADETRDLLDSNGWEGPAVYPYWPGEG